MAPDKLAFDEGVTLLGGGPPSRAALEAALRRAPRLVCADGGANELPAAAPEPAAIIGDLDSLAAPERWRARLGARLIHVAEQDSTDFEKCLRLVTAPFFIAVGFTGGRIDHELAALHALVADPRPVLLLSETDVALSAARPLEIALEAGDRVSVFPLRPVSGGSRGLRWPLDGLRLEAGGRIGTSNEATGPARIAFDGPGAVAMFEARRLDAALAAALASAGAAPSE